MLDRRMAAAINDQINYEYYSAFIYLSMSAQFAALPCGHASFAEVPELFLAQVKPFLASCGNA